MRFEGSILVDDAYGEDVRGADLGEGWAAFVAGSLRHTIPAHYHPSLSVWGEEAWELEDEAPEDAPDYVEILRRGVVPEEDFNT